MHGSRIYTAPLAFYVVRGGGPGRPARPAGRHDPGRHPQGVHRPEGVVLPVDPAMRLLGDMIEWCSREMPRWHPVSHLRLPHPRGGLDRRAGARLHAQGRLHLRRAGARPRARRRRLRAAPELLLQRADRLLRGDREDPRGPPDLGPRAARDLRRAGPAELADARRTSRPRACRSPRSSRSTTSSARRSRRSPACSAAPSRCTRTPTTRRSRCRRRTPCGSRCAPST